jgi:hypothetical protein
MKYDCLRLRVWEDDGGRSQAASDQLFLDFDPVFPGWPPEHAVSRSAPAMVTPTHPSLACRSGGNPRKTLSNIDAYSICNSRGTITRNVSTMSIN